MAKVLIGNFKGPKGDQGVKGDPGTAASIQVGTVQTVQPEENAEVTNTGTTTAAVLNFKIPRGEDGMTDLTAEYKDASSYTCQPTVNAPVVVKEVDGKTEQVETTGAQLFDASKIPTTSQGGATVTNNGDGSFTISGSGNLSSEFALRYFYGKSDFLKLGKITLNIGLSSIYPRVSIFGTSLKGSSIVANRTFSIMNNGFVELTEEILSNTSDVCVVFYGEEGQTIVPGTIKPMFYQDGDGTWEPYTGGSPAPSPDYPQVIKGVGGMGHFDGEWVQGNISSTGAIGTETTGITSANAIPCKQNDNIAVTYEDSIDVIAIAFYNASGAYISTSTSSNNVDTFTATAPANAASFKVNLRVASGSAITPSTAKYCTVTINGEYQTEVETQGRNLFDASKLPSKTQGGVTVTNNGDGSFTISGSGTVSEDFGQNYFDPNIVNRLKAGNIYLITGKVTRPYVEVQFQNSQGAAVKRLTSYPNASPSASFTEEEVSQVTNYGAVIWARAGQTVTPGTIKPMLYQDGDGTWQPYHHATLTIPLTSPLYEGDKICYVKPGESYVDAGGTTVVADRILYGVYRENAAVVFDGSEDENFSEASASPGKIAFRMNDKAGSFYGGEEYLKCDKLKTVATNISVGDMSENSIKESGAVGDNAVFIYINEEVNTVQLFRTWLQSNPLTVLYKLAQPYFEPFTDQSVFYGLRTDDTLSYVYSNDPIEPVLTVEVAKNSTGGYLLESYAQAQKNAISEANSQSRISAIEQQLVNQATTPTE